MSTNKRLDFGSEIGRMISWLKETKRYDNTVIIIISDHTVQ